MPSLAFPIDDSSIWQIGAGPPVGAPPADKEFHRNTNYPPTTYQPNAARTAWEAITSDLSGGLFSLAPFTPFTRSPQQADFNAALSADVSGAQLYKAGDQLMVETPDDGHFFIVRVAENENSPGTLMLTPMDVIIPSGLEFTALPTNRATYHEGYRIDVGGVVYSMVNGSWFRMGAGVTATGSGSVDTAAVNALIATAITNADVLSKASMKAVLDTVPMLDLSEGTMTTTEVNNYEAERVTQGI